MARSGLTLRLLMFLALAFLPAVGALLYVQHALRQEFSTRVSESVLHRAQLVSATAATMIDAARELSQVVARLDQSAAFAADCEAELAGFRASLTGYALLEIVDATGAPICRAGIDGGAAVQGQVAAAIAAGGFHAGRFARAVDGRAILPIIQPFTASTALRAVVVAIDLGRLQQRFGPFATAPTSRLDLADTDGVVLLQLPSGGQAIGHPDTSRVIHAAAPGTLKTGDRLAGFVPAAAASGVFVSYSVSLPQVLSGIDRETGSGARVALGCALISLLLLIATTRQLIYTPTQALLTAAQRWARGDLAVRATMPGGGHGEFGRLAAAFNAMAEALETRRRQMEELNASLEGRVAARTHSLSETNNRLLVEINERERADAALRHSQKLQAVGQLAGGVAHEFNNLLTTVLGALELMRLRLPADHPLQRSVAAAAQAAQRGARLTSQLLVFARRRRLMPIAVNLNAVIGDIRELLEGSLGRSIGLKLDLSGDLWLALADRNEIEAAILNLALNAGEAMGQGGTLRIGTRNVTLPLPGGHAEPAGAFVELLVEDDGAGMSEEELARAVEPFFTTKAPGHGAGLGLSHVHGIVQQLGGDMQIASATGRGTTVSLYLPRAIAVEGALAPTAARVAPARMNVLLVDDDEQVRQVAMEMLAELGYEVTALANGAAAMDVLRHPDRRFAAMVVDYAMPGLSGLEVIAQARSLRPDMITVLITGYMEIDGAPDMHLLEPRQVLRKPFTLSELAARIEDLTSNHAAAA